jgi:hypothetical protein
MLGIERQRLHQLNSAPTTPVSKLSLAADDSKVAHSSWTSAITALCTIVFRLPSHSNNFAVISDGVKSNDFSIE